MKCCRTCLRHTDRPDGSHRCNMTQDKIPEDVMDVKSCNLWAGPNARNDNNIKYKDYEDESQIERTRTCEDCKHHTEAYDMNKECNRIYCPRKDAFIADASLAGSTCGWYSEKKKK